MQFHRPIKFAAQSAHICITSVHFYTLSYPPCSPRAACVTPGLAERVYLVWRAAAPAGACTCGGGLGGLSLLGGLEQGGRVLGVSGVLRGQLLFHSACQLHYALA
jgi:hypothetical protein